MIEALVGCVAGASLVTSVENMARDAGFLNVTLKSKTNYIEAMSNWEDPLYHNIIAALPVGAKASDYITSLDIEASK